MFQRKTPEQLAQEATRKQQQRHEADARRREEQVMKARNAFFISPPGQARLAFERGDHVFQYSMNVMSQEAIIVPMVGSTTSQKTSDPVAILNAVCREGWELLNGSFVFVQEGQQSRDKFAASGQNIATKGRTVGYYLFKRCEDHRRESTNPWESVA
ncbi:hypothetical protein [Micromonospora sp. LH3U1]|uniref:hypothetical protein n=1 Tax=Micromonospora sp. LH3U1 TaxID=3018339 RepID=UPI00234BFD65|nr:hypothetical protein [Micromonospora sp. LH3U1]WCN84285.1 hypothetical protein PCA76_15125 [Micromonospora sp. LH3U1]